MSICKSCYSEIGQGLSHVCHKQVGVNNLILLAFTLGSLQAEQVASGIIKTRMEKDDISKGSSFHLSTGGNPLLIQVGVPDLVSARKSTKQISIQVQRINIL